MLYSIEGCHFYIKLGGVNDQSDTTTSIKIAHIQQLGNKNIGIDENKVIPQQQQPSSSHNQLMTLYQTKRTKRWYSYPLLSCRVVRTGSDCIQVQLPVTSTPTNDNKTSETPPNDVLKMNWECVSKEVDQCLQAASIRDPLDGSKRVILKVNFIFQKIHLLHFYSLRLMTRIRDLSL